MRRPLLIVTLLLVSTAVVGLAPTGAFGQESPENASNVSNRTAQVGTGNATTPGAGGGPAQGPRTGTPAQPATPSGPQAAPADLEVVDANTSAGVGGSGMVEVVVENTGEEDLSDVAITFGSSNAALTFGGATTARTYVGDLDAGEEATIATEASFAPTAENRSYAIDLTVDYTDEDGNRGRVGPYAAGVTPDARQAFAVEDVNASLRVGTDGTLAGTVVNEGPNDVEDAVLVLRERGGTIAASETEYALGDLAAGDGARFAYDLAVSDAASAGPRQFDFVVRYPTDDGGVTESAPLYVTSNVSAASDVFAVEPVRTNVTAGGGGEVRLRVTNVGDERVTDVSAKLFGDEPVSVDDSEAYVRALDPGESATLTFKVSVAGSALAKDYPVSLDFQYEDADGDTKLSTTYRVPVEVGRSEGGGLLWQRWLPGLGGGLGVLALGYLLVGRR
ncbi:COG1361 S-layer family protein [Halomarina pelagica]|uniref:COG1361 S-layer family protein n=1 Tax=Halomarina pelagica TaxID=2961599 RepID=UPI0020C50E6E|nr:NEW3 domain-containing protein [Halomarina sp. BND7]